jgi:tape measure domain-containing protein
MAGILSIKIRADATPFERSLKTIGRNITAFSQKSLAIGRGISLGFTAPLMAVGATAVNAAADFDSLERALSGIMGGANAATGEMMKLKEAARLPGLGFEEAVRGSVNLQAVGLSADEARKTLIGFGTAIAASGGGAVNLASVTKQLTQMISKNRILQEDFGILQENVPLIGDALEKAFGTRNIETVRATGIAAKDFNLQLVGALQTLPAVQAATGGLRNNIDNFKDSLKFTQVELGKAILKNIDLEGALESVSNVIEGMLNWWGSLSDEMQSNMISAAKYIAIAGGVLWVVGQLTSAFGTITMMIGNLVGAMFKLNQATGTYQVLMGGWVTITLAAVAAVALFAYNIHQANKPIDDLSGFLSSSAKAMQKEITQLEFSFKLINDTNTSNKLRLQLINEIKNKYGQYLPDLKTEQDYLNNMSKVMTVLNFELAKKFDIMKLQGVADKQLERSVDLLDKERQAYFEIEKLKKRNQEIDKKGFSVFRAAEAASNTQNIKALYKEIEKIKKESVVIESAWSKTSEELNKLLGDVPQLDDKLFSPTTGSGLDKAKTKYELLQETLKNLEKQYENQVLLYGKNSTGAEALADKIRSVKFEINSVISALKELEKIDSFSEFKPLPTGASEANKQAQNKAADEAARKETLEVFTPSILQPLTGGGSLDDFLEQNRLSEGEKSLTILKQRLAEAKPQVDKLKESFKQLDDVIYTLGETFNNNLGNALASSFEALGSALANGENALLSFGKTFVTVMLDAVNSALQLLLVEMVTNSIINGGGPIGSILAVGLGIAAISFLKSKMDSVKLAQGGLAFGPTLATVGDNRGASYDPEVIAPLSKLKSMLGDVGGGNPYVLTTRVAGSDLLVIMEKARNLNTRIR